MAMEGGLDIIAMTDHDLTADLAPGVHRRGDRSLFLIQGAEMTGVHEGREYHLLVYFPRNAPSEFLQLCRHQVNDRKERYKTAVANLGLTNLTTPGEFNARGTEALTRHHLAQNLVSAGHAENLSVAFKVFANRENVPTMKMPFLDCIRMAKEFGGITSWAHPPIQDLKNHIDDFAAAGLMGIEAIRPGVGRVARKTYKKAAKKHGLLLTGGSDWHGWKDSSLGLFYIYQRDLQPFFDALWAKAA
jgi:predicted metal-dependent phosphoesterase TrpH